MRRNDKSKGKRGEDVENVVRSTEKEREMISDVFQHLRMERCSNPQGMCAMKRNPSCTSLPMRENPRSSGGGGGEANEHHRYHYMDEEWIGRDVRELLTMDLRSLSCSEKERSWVSLSSSVQKNKEHKERSMRRRIEEDEKEEEKSFPSFSPSRTHVVSSVLEKIFASTSTKGGQDGQQEANTKNKEKIGKEEQEGETRVVVVGMSVVEILFDVLPPPLLPSPSSCSFFLEGGRKANERETKMDREEEKRREEPIQQKIIVRVRDVLRGGERKEEIPLEKWDCVRSSTAQCSSCTSSPFTLPTGSEGGRGWKWRRRRRRREHLYPSEHYNKSSFTSSLSSSPPSLSSSSFSHSSASFMKKRSSGRRPFPSSCRLSSARCASPHHSPAIFAESLTDLPSALYVVLKDAQEVNSILNSIEEMRGKRSSSSGGGGLPPSPTTRTRRTGREEERYHDVLHGMKRRENQDKKGERNNSTPSKKDDDDDEDDQEKGRSFVFCRNRFSLLYYTILVQWPYSSFSGYSSSPLSAFEMEENEKKKKGGRGGGRRKVMEEIGEEEFSSSSSPSSSPQRTSTSTSRNTNGGGGGGGRGQTLRIWRHWEFSAMCENTFPPPLGGREEQEEKRRHPPSPFSSSSSPFPVYLHFLPYFMKHALRPISQHCASCTLLLFPSTRKSQRERAQGLHGSWWWWSKKISQRFIRSLEGRRRRSKKKKKGEEMWGRRRSEEGVVWSPKPRAVENGAAALVILRRFGLPVSTVRNCRVNKEQQEEEQEWRIQGGEASYFHSISERYPITREKGEVEDREGLRMPFRIPSSFFLPPSLPLPCLGDMGVRESRGATPTAMEGPLSMMLQRRGGEQDIQPTPPAPPPPPPPAAGGSASSSSFSSWPFFPQDISVVRRTSASVHAIREEAARVRRHFEEVKGLGLGLGWGVGIEGSTCRRISDDGGGNGPVLRRRRRENKTEDLYRRDSTWSAEPEEKGREELSRGFQDSYSHPHHHHHHPPPPPPSCCCGCCGREGCHCFRDEGKEEERNRRNRDRSGTEESRHDEEGSSRRSSNDGNLQENYPQKGVPLLLSSPEMRTTTTPTPPDSSPLTTMRNRSKKEGGRAKDDTSWSVWWGNASLLPAAHQNQEGEGGAQHCALPSPSDWMARDPKVEESGAAGVANRVVDPSFFCSSSPFSCSAPFSFSFSTSSTSSSCRKTPGVTTGDTGRGSTSRMMRRRTKGESMRMTTGPDTGKVETRDAQQEEEETKWSWSRSRERNDSLHKRGETGKEGERGGPTFSMVLPGSFSPLCIRRVREEKKTEKEEKEEEDDSDAPLDEEDKAAFTRLFQKIFF